MIPDTIAILGYNISALYFFLAASFIFSLFIIWYEGKKDGFEENKLLDLFFLTILVSLILSRLFYSIENSHTLTEFLRNLIKFWSLDINIYGALVGFILVIFYLTDLWRWSVFRILDIFTLAALVGFNIALLGHVLITARLDLLLVNLVWFLCYLVFAAFRNSSLKSGFSFFLFLVISVILGMLYYREYKHLIFYITLITLGVVTLYLRRKENMQNSILPTKFLNTLKSKLRRKEKELSVEQQLLLSEDPFADEGRVTDNAENVDEAILEMQRKRDWDAQNESVNSMLLLVRKALAKIRLGSYGKCEICGNQIDKARLKAMPTATKCLEHADS